MKRVSCCVFSFCLVLLLHSAATAAIWHVSPAGDDGNDGRTWAAAKKHIQSAIDAASAGDEVWAAAGTYNERLTVKAGLALYGGFAGNESSIGQQDLSENETAIVFDGRREQSSVVLVDSVFDGFTVRDGRAQYGGGISASGSCVIARCVIADNSAARNGGGIYATGELRVSECLITGNSAQTGGGIYAVDCALAVEGNTIRQNRAYTNNSNLPAWGGAICCDNTGAPEHAVRISGNTVRDCEAVGYNASGAGVYVSAGYVLVHSNLVTDCFCAPAYSGGTHMKGGGIVVDGLSSTADAMISNNTVAGCSIRIVTYGGAIAGRDCTIANNIAAFCSSGIQVDGYSVVRNNCLHGNRGYNANYWPIPADHVLADPRFRNAQAGDFRLGPGSPCINAGSSSDVAGDLGDAAGNPRIVGPAVDIGAYEVQYETGKKNLIVKGGSGSGVYEPLSVVEIQADPPLEGQVFEGWTGDTQLVADQVSPTTTIWLVDDAEVRAGYRSARTLHVRPDGDDTGDGFSWETAKRTAQAAAAAARNGEEIRVAQGTYQGPVVLRAGISLLGGYNWDGVSESRDMEAYPCILQSDITTGAVVTAEGENLVEGLTLRSGLYGVLAHGTNGVTVRGNSINGCQGAAVRADFAAMVIAENSIADCGAGVVATSDGAGELPEVRIINNEIVGCDWPGIEMEYVIGTVQGNRIIAGGMDGVCLFGTGPYNLRANDISDNIGAGVRAEERALTMARNRITANGDGGVRIVAGSAPGAGARLESNVIAANNALGVSLSDADHLLLNNTIASNFGPGIATGGQGRFVNNLIAFNRRGISGEVAERANNNIFGNFFGDSPDSSAGPGDISADPLLASVRTGDFHIRPGSPCVGAGGTAYLHESADIDGQDRVFGDSVDIGADESYGEARVVTPRVIRVGPPRESAPQGYYHPSWSPQYSTLEEAMADCALHGPADIWLPGGIYRPLVRLLPFVTVIGDFRANEPPANGVWPPTADTLLLPPAGASAAVSFSSASTLEQVRIGRSMRGAFCYRASPSIERCHFQENDVGLYARESSPALMSSVVEVYGAGIEVWSGDPIITNNTVYRPANSTSTQTTFGMNWYGGDAYVANSIFAHCNTQMRWSAYPQTPRTVYSTVCYPSPPSYIVGYTIADPWNGVKPLAGGDVSLPLASPLVDAGLMTVPAFTALDFYGGPRIAFGRVDIGACELGEIPDIADVKLLPEFGQTVRISGVVTGVFPFGFYLQTFPDGSSARVDVPGRGPSGILVETTALTGISYGKRALVVGKVSERGREICIHATGVYPQEGQCEPEALRVTCASIGGGAFGLQRAIWRSSFLRREASTMQGLSNVGLLVTITGRVTYSNYDRTTNTYTFTIDDGAGFYDNYIGRGIRVECGAHQAPPWGSTVQVRGISAIGENAVKSPVSVLRVSRAEDMEVLED